MRDGNLQANPSALLQLKRVVAINSASEPSCISSISTRGKEAECAAEVEGRVTETDRRSPESPTGPTPKLRPDLVVICCFWPPLHLRSC